MGRLYIEKINFLNHLYSRFNCGWKGFKILIPFASLKLFVYLWGLLGFGTRRSMGHHYREGQDGEHSV